jgi:hypothetical protein
VNLNSLSLTALHTHDLDGAQQHAQQALTVAHTIRYEPDVLSSISDTVGQPPSAEICMSNMPSLKAKKLRKLP